MPFGKYAGAELHRVPIGYLTWLANSFRECPTFVCREIDRRLLVAAGNECRKMSRKSSRKLKGQPSDLPGKPGFIGRDNADKPVHIWTGTDTVCRMFSTGGIPSHSLHWYADIDRRVCKNCLKASGRATDRGRATGRHCEPLSKCQQFVRGDIYSWSIRAPHDFFSVMGCVRDDLDGEFQRRVREVLREP